ncbi:MAG: hypothetical protein K2K23_05010 [Muribaculaceae bacterium]|nr:hypothetical protein [Muribaculaceae bacterium]
MKKTDKTNKPNKPNETNKANWTNKTNWTDKANWTDKPNLIKALISIAFILFCYVMLVVRNGYMLRWYDEMSLFEPTRFFFRECLYFPGGLLRYAGAWLTQLLYYPLLGSTALIAVWILTAWITQMSFRLPSFVFPLSFIVPMAMLVSIVQIDDAWISMKSVGYIYSNSLGYLFVAAAVWAFRQVEKRQAAAFIMLLAVTVCYFIAGFYALFAAFIGVIFLVAESIRSKRYAGIAIGIVVVAAVCIFPYLYYQCFQPTTVDNDYLILKGLPDFLMESFDLYLWVPFIVATAFFLVLAVLSAVGALPAAAWMMWVSLGALCVSGGWCVVANQKNEQFRATVLMLQHLENNDWKGMTVVMSRIKEPPSYTMRVLYNFAVVNLGGKSEELGEYKPRNIDPRHAEGFSYTAYVNIPISYYNGNFNLSHRWAMEHSVQYGKRVFFLKFMVKNALLNGEIALAKRYNDLLLGTLFHREWAEEMQRYIEDPSLIGTNPEFKSVLEVAGSAKE